MWTPPPPPHSDPRFIQNVQTDASFHAAALDDVVIRHVIQTEAIIDSPEKKRPKNRFTLNTQKITPD